MPIVIVDLPAPELLDDHALVRDLSTDARGEGIDVRTATPTATNPPEPDKVGEADPPQPDKTGTVDPPNPDKVFLADPPSPDKVGDVEPPQPDKEGLADPPEPDMPGNWGVKVG